MLVAAPESGLMVYRLEAGRVSSAATPVAPYSTGAAEAAGTASAPTASTAPAAAMKARTGLGTFKLLDHQIWVEGTRRRASRVRIWRYRTALPKIATKTANGVRPLRS